MDSSEVTAGADAEASQYNNLREDLIRAGGDYAISGGAANVQTLSIDSQYDAYRAGDILVFKVGIANNSAVTFNVNTLGALSVRKNNNALLEDGDWVVNQIVVIIHNGTTWQMVSPVVKNSVDTINADWFTWSAQIGGSGVDEAEYSGWSMNNVVTANNSTQGPGFALIEMDVAAADGYVESKLPRIGTNLYIRFGSGKDFVWKGTVQNRNNADDLAWGFAKLLGLGILLDETDSDNDTARFFYNKGTDKLWAITSNGGVGVTATDVTADITAITNKNLYMIKFVSATRVIFYINGVDVANHTTNLPDGDDDMYFMYAMKQASVDGLRVSPSIFSVEI